MQSIDKLAHFLNVAWNTRRKRLDFSIKLTSVRNYCIIELDGAPPMIDGTDDERSRRQANQLRVFLSKLADDSDEQVLPDVELSFREVRLMRALGERREMTMTDLAGVIRAPLSTVTRMVDRLESKGLAERFRSAEDRRIVVVRIAMKGQELCQLVERFHLDIARRMLEPLTPGEREILLELIAKMFRSKADTGPSAG
jgi:DNA-binding MarR family transcriptional regulator